MREPRGAYWALSELFSSESRYFEIADAKTMGVGGRRPEVFQGICSLKRVPGKNLIAQVSL